MGYMDWDNQPDPFRRYDDATRVPLPRINKDSPITFDEIFAGTLPKPATCALESLAALLELSLGLSAWKQFRGNRWALRMNPSSGNLHPTEAYLVCPQLDGLPASGVFHYVPADHALEHRAAFDAPAPDTPLIVLTSIHWREAWKYGERAFRYCQHDVGHALAALAISAAMLGWQVRPRFDLPANQLATVLGLDRPNEFTDGEPELAETAIALIPHRHLPEETASIPMPMAWFGRPNRLSREHVDWPMITAVARACDKPPGLIDVSAPAFPTPMPAARAEEPAAKIIRQRRSATAMDGETRLTSQQFYLMMDRVLPRPDRPPFTVLDNRTLVHLGLFVHLVDDLTPGLYVLVRDPSRLDTLQEAMRDAFLWRRPDTCPQHLPLYLLHEQDLRAIAQRVSCDQQIAGASAFSLGMIAEFDGTLKRQGAWGYKRLFWECGVIGQVLYLEAEAAGVRSTGIGCFYDDPVHQVFGLADRAFQSLYHFTVGGSVEDTRLVTLDPYGR